ncbi:YybH family protein [Haladaptatus sp. GCM10025707]
MTRAENPHVASDRFYEALERMANGDAGLMEVCWSHSDDVTTMHPIGGREEGWDAVRDSWAGVAELASNGSVTRTDQLVRTSGELACELVTETVSMDLGGHALHAEFRATNVYRLEDGDWKIIHHHADANQEFQDILAQLTTAE